MVKQSCHDSGIDIREPSLVGPSRKTTYSDAEILLADRDEFVPPKLPRQPSRSEEDSSLGTKKSTSVSFSLDDSKENSLDLSTKSSAVEEADKPAETKQKIRVSFTFAISKIRLLRRNA